MGIKVKCMNVYYDEGSADGAFIPILLGLQDYDSDMELGKVGE